MNLANLIKPRVLIVENDKIQLLGIRDDLMSISSKRLKKLGIDSFVCDLAESVEDAEAFFEKTGECPYDLLILDLGIPKRTGDKKDPIENGKKLLEKAKKEGKTKEVIVVSVWNIGIVVTETFRNGAIDFVAKPFRTEFLQARVLDCWKRLLIKEGKQMLNEKRISDLVPYAEKGLAYRFNKCFFEFMKEVKYSNQDLEKHMQERYGLYRQKDGDDVFFRRLDEQDNSMAKAKTEWDELQHSLSASTESSETSDIKITREIETLIREIHQNLLPCFIIKNVQLKIQDKSTSGIISFGDDVSAIIREIIIGALIDLTNYNTPRHIINIRAENINQQVRVTFSDKLEHISNTDAENINKGSNISPYRRFGREWGLSVVQHIAMRGFGRLEIEPQADGNVINYFIPTA